MCEEYESFRDENVETRCGRTVDFLVRAKCDQHKRSLLNNDDPTHKDLTVAKVRRTS